MNNPSLRIDWFDGTVIEDTRTTTASDASEFADEDQADTPQSSRPQYTEKKPIGFKRLLDISLLKTPILTLEVSNRPGFWNLFDGELELKGDFIVLIVKILASVYNDLQPGEKSKIVTLLKTRFELSNFLENLKEYLIGLPSVRVVEKRMNAHLWDDVQSFYFNVVALCKGMSNLGATDIQILTDVNDLLEITETSALGVHEEHTETFHNSLFEGIAELSKIHKIIEGSILKKNPVEILQTENEIHGKNHFKNLSIFPSKQDLLGGNSVEIKPNIINGSYSSVDHYLDLQFKLLREDCFGPLREGISKYMENPSRNRHENIRVHPKVRIIRTFITNNKVGHLVDLAWSDRLNQSVDSKKYAYNKQLMFGSLLLFTSDNFDTILCATVLDSSLGLLNDGYVAVSFQNPVSKNILGEQYLMVESEVFFEPYHQVLNVIQNACLDDLPMKKYIVDVQKETRPPSYITPETMYTMKPANELVEITFPVLETEQWPTESGLDYSQTEALTFALTREFAVIQGPPGTGKTFIGVKIATTLLKNLSLEGTPMLVICYTNHALDQFLEGISNETNNIVRLGSQSKSKILEPYNLNAMRSKLKSKYSHLYGSKRAELEKIYKEMTELQAEIEKCEMEILTYKTVKPYLKIELKCSNEDPLLNWLFNHLEDILDEDSDDELEDWEQLNDDICDNNVDTCFSEKWALKEIESTQNSIKYVKDITDDHFEGEKMTDKFETHVRKIRKRLLCFKKKMAALHTDGFEKSNSINSDDPYKMSTDDRWAAYFDAVSKIKDKFILKMNELLAEHEACSRELSEVSTLIDSDVMKTARVVGVTTSTAARRHDLITKLHSSIVIVEEAAEVLEAHIVASLTNHCQHLILIGDHMQLPPSPAHYKLAKHYNLEISLFERMIRNGVHARTLSIQRRMRPDFVKLIVPVIYDKLECHDSVYKFDNVRGMRDNLYFYSHDVFEDSEGLEDSWSHKNTLEAKLCVSLANYLRQMNYHSTEITILTTYTGQATLIKQLSKNYSLLRDVKTTEVDNYQGEENRIVILSLVRSNRDNKIGFLNATNRICVALSRAKEGFYMFGNMNSLKTASAIWWQINNTLIALRAIGNVITLRCDKHPDNMLQAEHSEDLDSCRSRDGSCLRICDDK